MSDQIDEATAPSEAVRWMIVEIFGHRQHAGRCFTEERFGVAGVRIDEPQATLARDGAAVVWTTHWYAGAAVFSVQETTEAAVMRRAGVKPPPAITADAGHPLLAGAIEPEICPICGDRLPSLDCGRPGCPAMPF